MGIREWVFPDFKSNKKWIVIFGVLMMLISVFIIFNKEFIVDDLKELSTMAINTELVLAALVISIISIQNNNNNAEKERVQRLILSYIGSVLFVASAATFGYILTYAINVLPETTGFWLFDRIMIIKLYSVLMINFVSNSIMNSAKYIMEVFKIR